MRSRALTSAPAQNPRPAPVITTARTSGDASTVRRTQPYSDSIRTVHALRRSGRSSVRTATPSAISQRRVFRSTAAGPCARLLVFPGLLVRPRRFLALATSLLFLLRIEKAKFILGRGQVRRLLVDVQLFCGLRRSEEPGVRRGPV